MRGEGLDGFVVRMGMSFEVRVDADGNERGKDLPRDKIRPR